MNFRDRWAEKENGERFVFTVEMQRRLSQAGLPIDPSAVGQLGTVERTSQPERQPERYERRERSEPEQRAPERSSRPDERSSSPRGGEIVGPATIQIDPVTGKYVGRVKWYNTKKGYGFIVRGAGEEIFFHKSATVGDMEEFDEGQWILYDVETTAKGPEATDVEPYTGEPLE